MDYDDDDGPPELVETGHDIADEEKPIRVPITIVTGMNRNLPQGQIHS